MDDPKTLEQEAQDEADLRSELLRQGIGWKPDERAATALQGFLDHRDVYEHTAEHVALAHALLDIYHRPEDEEDED